MKILFFLNSIPPDYGGGYLRVYKIASRFKQKGFLFKILTFTKAEIYSDSFGLNLKDIAFIPSKILSPLFLIGYIIRNKKKFDVLYVASSQWFTVVPVYLCYLLRKKVVIGITLSKVDSPAAPITKGILQECYYHFKNAQFKKASYLFVNSLLLQRECIECGYAEQNVKLINNPVDTNLFFPVSQEEKRKMRILEGLNPDLRTYLFVGSINSRKGADLLPPIFERFFQETGIKVNFIICGQAGYQETNKILEDLDNLFSQFDSKLLVKNEVKDTSCYYQMTDVFIFPTTNEGMPNVVLEAMASGCMIICNTLPGITDSILQDDFLVCNNSIPEYISKMLRFEKQPMYCNELIKYNLNLIFDKYSIDKVDKSIIDILK